MRELGENTFHRPTIETWLINGAMQEYEKVEA